MIYEVLGNQASHSAVGRVRSHGWRRNGDCERERQTGRCLGIARKRGLGNGEAEQPSQVSRLDSTLPRATEEGRWYFQQRTAPPVGNSTSEAKPNPSIHQTAPKAPWRPTKGIKDGSPLSAEGLIITTAPHRNRGVPVVRATLRQAQGHERNRMATVMERCRSRHPPLPFSQVGVNKGSPRKKEWRSR